jgi:hypothetical protein
MYSFAAGAFYSIVAWAIFYTVARRTRKVVLSTSLAFCWVGPVLEYWHHKDYWNPEYVVRIAVGDWVFGIEDFLFSFAFAGLCAGVFDLIARRLGHDEEKGHHPSGLFVLALVGLGYAVVVGVLAEVFDFHSYYAVVATSLLATSVVLLRRPRWIPAAILAAFALGLSVWLSYWGFYLKVFPGIIEKWWNHDFLVGVFVAGVPVEEVIWAVACGLSVGPVVKYCIDKPRRPFVSRRAALAQVDTIDD